MTAGARDAGADGRLPDGAARARRDGRGDHRRGADDALAHEPRSRRRPAPSTSSAPAATATAPTTSRPARRWSRPAPASRSPSTATARVSSMSGASDVLAALGVKLDVGPDDRRARDRRGRRRLHVGADAPPGHEALGADPRRARHPHHLQSARARSRNPAGVKRQVVGVFSWHWVEPIAQVLKNLGAEHVWVVHGHDGLDELTTTGADRRRRAQGRQDHACSR